MLKIYGQKDSPVVFSLYYGKGGILTFELWDKNTKDTQKVRIWNNYCPFVRDTLVAFVKNINSTELQHYSVSDVNGWNKKLDIFCGNGVLALRIGNLKFLVQEIRNVISITEYISGWASASIMTDIQMETNYKLDSPMKKAGISAEKPKLGEPRPSNVPDDVYAGNVKMYNLINSLSEGANPNGNGGDNGNNKVEDKLDEDIEK